MTSSFPTENELKKRLHYFDQDFIETHLTDRNSSVESFNMLEEDAKAYYLNLVNIVDNMFNDADPQLQAGFEKMIAALVEKHAEDPIQLLSFCFRDSGDFSLLLSAFESVNEADHTQLVSADETKAGLVQNHYLDSLTNLFHEIYYSPFIADCEDECEDFWCLVVKDKALSHIAIYLKNYTNEFDFSPLNITYPLYVYLDFPGKEAGNGLLVNIITSG